LFLFFSSFFIIFGLGENTHSGLQKKKDRREAFKREKEEILHRTPHCLERTGMTFLFGPLHILVFNLYQKKLFRHHSSFHTLASFIVTFAYKEETVHTKRDWIDYWEPGIFSFFLVVVDKLLAGAEMPARITPVR
jgi:hypothetical protein